MANLQVITIIGLVFFSSWFIVGGALRETEK